MSFGRRFLRQLKKNPFLLGATLFLAGLLVLTLGAPWLVKVDPYQQDLMERLQPPSAQHWLGTDEAGRDVFSRIAYGGRYSLLIGLLGAAGGLLVGVTLGTLSGYRGGWLDHLLMRLIDIMMAFPGVLLVILIVAILGPGLHNLILALIVWFTPTFARISRAGVLSLKGSEFVEAARASGAGHGMIIAHILRNTLSPIVVYFTLSVATSILAAAGLSFLGLGVQPPTPEWGAMVGAARAYLRDAPYLITFPGLFIFFTVLSINLLGDALRDLLDPRLRG